MASGTGEWDGNGINPGYSLAYRYIVVDSTSFNSSNGVTTVNFHVGTWVSYGDFWGSTFHSWGSCDDYYNVNGSGGYDIHYLQATVAYNGYIAFREGCGYTSGSAGWLESNVAVDWYPTLPTYTVSYNANGGSNAPSSQSKTWGYALTLTSNKPTRTGYTFVKWNTKSDGTGTDYASGASYSSNSNNTLYAIWRKNTWVVTYKANGGTGSDFTDTKTYNETLTLSSGTSFSRTYYSRLKWNTSADGGGTSYNLGGSYTSNANLTLYMIWKLNQPSAPTSLSITRNSDTSATLSWTRPSDAGTTWEKVYIYRSVDGNEYTSLTNIAGTATSYTDTTTTANHSYQYQVKSYNSGGGGQYSTAATTSTIYNTPSAPTAVTAAPVLNSTNVTLTLSNNATTATGFDVQYSADGETWSTSGLTVQSSSGDPVTTINLGMTNGGQFYFRVRNKRGSLTSAWTVSNRIVTITPPNPPFLNSPASGGFVIYGGSTTSVTFDWTHQAIDSTAQEKAQVGVSINGGTETIYTVNSSAQTLTQSISAPLNASVTWRARTKGADPDYGAWSGTSTFAVYQAPSLSVTEPHNNATIIGVPVYYELTYTDASGVFASGRLDIKYNGTTVYSESLDEPQSGTIEGSVFASEFIPDDGKTYTFLFTAASNTTLTTTAQVSVSVDMEAPYIGTLQIENDPETGYVSLTYGWDSSSGGQPVNGATLYRITEQGRVELAYSSTNNASCLDMYAPLNTDYKYLVVTHGTNLAISQIEFANKLNTGWWFVYWNGQIARAKWNPNGTKTVSRPERTRVHYIGRPDPVSYDGTAVLEESSMEWRIVEREYAMQFLKMVREIGRGVYKSGSGEVYHADFDSASVESDFHRNAPYGTLTLPIVRIDGDVL